VGERDAPGGDPRGALRARLAEASFPMLSANLIEQSTGRAPSWGNLHPSTLVEVGGVKLGIVGVITRETPQIVMPAHFAGLDVTPLAPAIVREAAALRRRAARGQWSRWRTRVACAAVTTTRRARRRATPTKSSTRWPGPCPPERSTR
jgi:hypothetical protein